jgi:polysaccharide biosynthesis/export protein
MKKTIFIMYAATALALLVTTTTTAAAQQTGTQGTSSGTTASEPQKPDPQTLQAIMNAVQRGDLEEAEQLYHNAKNVRSQQSLTAPRREEARKHAQPSLFELTLPGNLKQFGYDLFNRDAVAFSGPASVAVGPDYILGPGDHFTLTLWGTTEGIFKLQVGKEGAVTLPKVGVVSVAGVRFGELEKTLKRHLARYYSEINLSVAMGDLKTIMIYAVGEVAQPGSYSVSSLTTAYGALFAAGGPTKQGTLRAIQVLRGGRVVKTMDLYDFLLKGDRSQDIKLQNEDTVFVPLVGPVVGVAGAVYRQAIYEIKGRETLDDALKTAGGILPTALGGRLQLTRYEDNRKKIILDIRLDEAAQKTNDTFSEKIRNMDTISIRPLYDKVWETVNLNGAVRHPGDIQWRPDLRLKEVVEQGGLLPFSDLTRVEVVRLNADYTDRRIISADVGALLKGDEAQNIPLEPKDEIRVYTRYKEAEKVVVSGEVLRPGAYEVAKGDRLSDLLRRVGGVTAEGYIYGAVFKRASVKTKENKNIGTFSARMQTQMLMLAAGNAATAVSPEEAAAAKMELGINQGLIENVKTILSSNDGRIALAITEKIDDWAGSKDDLVLQDGDTLFIPKKPQEVLVVGEIYSPGAQIFLPEMTVKDYIGRSGGATKYADKDQVFVVQANGYAYGTDSPGVGNIESVKVKAGDVVFVPQKLERYATMRTTKDIIDILFKTAVVIATITILF